MRLGVLALQGGFDAHAERLKRLGVPWVFVTHAQQLNDVHGLILPGGESSTMLTLLEAGDFFPALIQFAAERVLFGTCAGAILLAKKVLNPAQPSLGLINITVERNAYGRQLASHIGRGDYRGGKENFEMVFIRAPRILKLGSEVTVFASYANQPVGVIEKRCMLTTFHPELTADSAIHQLFIEKCEEVL